MSSIQKSSAYPDTVQPGIPKLPENPPNGWSRSKLGEHLFEEKRPVKMNDNEAYDLITVKRARGGVVKRETKLGGDISVKTQFEVKEGDFLISKRQIVHGACGLVPAGLDGATVSNEYAVLRGNSSIDLKFLEHLSHSIYFQQTCFHSSIGVHIEKMIFKTVDWFKWHFDLPPLKEQERIARILDTWDQAIEKTEALIANSEAQKKALMQQILNAGITHDSSDGGKITTIGDVCELVSGPAFESSNFCANGVRLLRGSNVKRGVLDWNAKLTEHWPNLSGYETYEIKKDDIVVAMDGYVGRSLAFIDEVPRIPMLLVQRVARVRPVSIEPELCFALLSTESFYRHCERRKTATAIAHITLKDIRQFNFIIPNKDLQKKYSELLKAARTDVEALKACREKLVQEKSGLMQQLLTGKRRVKIKEIAA